MMVVRVCVEGNVAQGLRVSVLHMHTFFTCKLMYIIHLYNKYNIGPVIKDTVLCV